MGQVLVLHAMTCSTFYSSDGREEQKQVNIKMIKLSAVIVQKLMREGFFVEGRLGRLPSRSHLN